MMHQHVCGCEWKGGGVHESLCKRMCVCVCACVLCVCMRVCVCVCVCVPCVYVYVSLWVCVARGDDRCTNEYKICLMK